MIYFKCVYFVTLAEIHADLDTQVNMQHDHKQVGVVVTMGLLCSTNMLLKELIEILKEIKNILINETT